MGWWDGVYGLYGLYLFAGFDDLIQIDWRRRRMDEIRSDEMR